TRRSPSGRSEEDTQMPIASAQKALRLVWIASALGFLVANPGFAAESSKPVFLYSRYFNAKGEGRYLPDGQCRDVLERLRSSYDVRVNDEPLNADTLKGVAVVLISNPSDKAFRNNPAPPHMSTDDVRELTRFVQSGGGLIAMGNQENHNLEINDFNQLLSQFGMKFVSNYTDAKPIAIPQDAPIIGGLRWAYYTGNQIVIDPNNAVHARPLVMNDGAKPLGGPRNPKG